MLPSEVMAAGLPLPRTNRQAALTFGSMLPVANAPPAIRASRSDTAMPASGLGWSLPHPSTTCSTSVAITSRSASSVAASRAAVRSLSMTASTPR